MAGQALSLSGVVKRFGLLTALDGNTFEWRLAWPAGFLASVGWFTAFTLQNAAYVREKTRRLEVLGLALILAAILTLVLVGQRGLPPPLDVGNRDTVGTVFRGGF